MFEIAGVDCICQRKVFTKLSKHNKLQTMAGEQEEEDTQ